MFFFFSPGHIGRINVTDSPFRIPGFASWTIIRKLYHGFSTTFSVLIFEPKILMIVFLVLLGIVFYINNKKIIGFIPLIIIIIMNIFGKSNYIFYYEYSCGMPDFCEIGSYNWILIIIASVLFIISVLYLLLKLDCSSTIKYSLILLLCLAVGSRIMMGFSSTLYGSSFRTFSFLYFILVIVNILLFDLILSSFHNNR